MDNKELEQEIKEIVFQENYFDMIKMVKDFEKKYKQSSFYKETKKPLKEVIKEAQIFYNLNLGIILQRLQNLIDNLNTEKIMSVIDKLGDVTAQQFLNINESFNDFVSYTKDLKMQ